MIFWYLDHNSDSDIGRNSLNSFDDYSLVLNLSFLSTDFIDLNESTKKIGSESLNKIIDNLIFRYILIYFYFFY